MTTFGDQKAFWGHRENQKLVGDFINRPAVIRMIGDVKGKSILEAGCGSGYVASLLARKGGIVWGIDKDKNILREAERSNTLGIRYQPGTIERLPYDVDSFDVVTLTSVLMYNDVEVMREAYVQAWKVTKPGGQVIVSVPHPHLYLPGSVARDDEDSWLKLNLHGTSPEGTPIFCQEYFDIEGKTSVLDVYDHPTDDYVNFGLQAGLVLKRMESVKFPEGLTKKSLKWGKTWGYDAYLLLKFSA
jgi:SAM-dependent methyltransferase